MCRSPIHLLRKNGEGNSILCFVKRALMYRARHRQCLSQSLCPVSAGHVLKYEIFTLSAVFMYFQVQGVQLCNVIWSSLKENCVFVLLNGGRLINLENLECGVLN